jgi:hypothetical protein
MRWPFVHSHFDCQTVARAHWQCVVRWCVPIPLAPFCVTDLYPQMFSSPVAAPASLAGEGRDGGARGQGGLQP